MSSSRVELEPSFVLHLRPYRETSLLVEAFTAEFGRIGLVARGARRPKSQLRGVLQPFRPLLLSWTGRQELLSLTRAEMEVGMPPPTGRALLSGFYVNELMIRLLHRHDAHPELFQSYRRVIFELSGGGAHEPILRVFEKRLLDAIGYGLVLDRDAESGKAIRPETLYWYRLDQGPVRATGQNSLGIPVHGSTLIALERERLDTQGGLREAKRVMRNVLKTYLGEKPLVTRELLKTIST